MVAGFFVDFGIDSQESPHEGVEKFYSEKKQNVVSIFVVNSCSISTKAHLVFMVISSRLVLWRL